MPECISSLLRVFKNEISILILEVDGTYQLNFYILEIDEDLDPIQNLLV